MVLGIPKRSLIIAALLVGVSLVYILGAGERQPPGDGRETTQTGCEFTVTADVLNVRESPSMTAQVVGRFQQEATVYAEPTVRNGFRKLAEHGWASEEFLSPIGDGKC